MANLVRILGLKQLTRKVSTLPPRGHAALVRGLKKAGLFLQRESQKIVPVDTGALKNSAFTRIVNEAAGSRKVDVEVGYTMHYAVYVHENTTARHKPGKRAKYLEHPMRLHRRRMLKMVSDEIKKYLR